MRKALAVFIVSAAAASFVALCFIVPVIGLVCGAVLGLVCGAVLGLFAAVMAFGWALDTLLDG